MSNVDIIIVDSLSSTIKLIILSAKFMQLLGRAPSLTLASSMRTPSVCVCVYVIHSGTCSNYSI